MLAASQIEGSSSSRSSWIITKGSQNQKSAPKAPAASRASCSLCVATAASFRPGRLGIAESCDTFAQLVFASCTGNCSHPSPWGESIGLGVGGERSFSTRKQSRVVPGKSRFTATSSAGTPSRRQRPYCGSNQFRSRDAFLANDIRCYRYWNGPGMPTDHSFFPIESFGGEFPPRRAPNIMNTTIFSIMPESLAAIGQDPLTLSEIVNP
jgi:hypothetical protein